MQAALQALEMPGFAFQGDLATRALEAFDGGDAQVEARLLVHVAWRMGLTREGDEAAERARELAQRSEVPSVLGELSRREASRAAGELPI